MTIGIIPCAGSATRIHGIPKALLPVNDTYLLARHIEAMRTVGVQGVIGTTTENSSFINRYSKGGFVYTVEKFATMTETVLSCERFASVNGVVTESVLFAMPDTYIEDDNCFSKLLDTLNNGADVAVGVFYARPDQHYKAGMCRLDHERVTEVVDKPTKTDMRWLWGALAWKPAFWDHMQPADAHVGYALPRAITAGMDVRAVRMMGGYWDCGTYDEYAELVNYLHGRKNTVEMAARIYA